MDYKELIEEAKRAAEKWAEKHPIIGVGQLRVDWMVADLTRAMKELMARAEKAEKERDAAVRDLRQMCVGGNTCAFCRNGRNCGKQGPGRKTVEPCWEWCGKKEE